MSGRCCGIFPLNTGMRIVAIVHILLSILLIADPTSTPFMQAAVYCQEAPSSSADKTSISFPDSVKQSLVVSDVAFGVAGLFCCSFILVRIENKYFLNALTIYFVCFALHRCFWAFFIGYSCNARQSILRYWDGVSDSEGESVIDACLTRTRRSAIVDALTTLAVYVYFALLAFKKFRHRDMRNTQLDGNPRQRLVEGMPLSGEDVAQLDLNVLGMNGRFFVGKPLDQRVLGRVSQ